MADTKVRLLRLRGFLEGQEIPVVSAVVNTGPGQAATATVQVPPHDSLHGIKPRSMLHVFLYDDTMWEEGMDPDELYQLYYWGEVTGLQDTRLASGNRVMALQCMDGSSCLDTAYHYQADVVDFSPMRQFMQAGSYLFDPIARQQQMVVNQLIQAGARSGPQTPDLKALLLQGNPEALIDPKGAFGLLGGLLRVMEAVGGVRENLLGVNDFFSALEYRNKFMYQVGCDTGKTSVNIFSYKTFEAWLNEGLASLGKLVSFRQIVQFVMGYVFYQMWPNPSPYYIRGNPDLQGIKIKATAKTKFTGIKELKKYYDRLKPLADKIPAAPLLGNVDWAVTLSTIMPFIHAAAAVVEDCEKDALRVQSKAIESQNDVMRAQLLALTNALAGAKEIYAITSLAAVQNIPGYRAALNIVLAALGALTNVSTPSLSVAAAPIHSARMLTQLVVPDIWFAPPPKCNVFFPDQYSQLAYSRAMLMETSRLQLRVSPHSLIGNEPLFFAYYYAPQDREIEQLIADKKLKAKVTGRTLNPAALLMDHEKFTGIIPSVESMSHANIFAARNLKRLMKGVDRKNPGKDRFLRYAAYAAHHSFFKKRFSARQISLTCPPNIRPVPGLPAAVITSPLWEEDLGGATPLHYVGLLSGATHSISQGGGFSSFVLTQVRTHRNLDDEYLNIRFLDAATPGAGLGASAGVAPAEGKKTVSTILSVSALTSAGDREGQRGLLYLLLATPQSLPGEMRDLSEVDTKNGYISKFAGMCALQNGMKGPKGGTITKIVIRNNSFSSVAARALRDILPDIAGILEDPALIGVATAAATLAATAAENSLDGVPNVFSSVEIFEEVDTSVYRAEAAFEDVCMPGWFDPIYRRENIGAGFYLRNIGCESVVDSLDSALSSKISALNIEGGDLGTVAELAAGVGAVAGIRVQDGLDYAAYLYGLAQKQDRTSEFTRYYTWRPIATMNNVLGGRLFRANAYNSLAANPLPSPATHAAVATGLMSQEAANAADVRYQIGFHGFATLPMVGFAGLALMAQNGTPLPRIMPEKVEGMSPLEIAYDVRKERWEKVQEYIRGLSTVTRISSR